jgi:hypothetical protein
MYFAMLISEYHCPLFSPKPCCHQQPMKPQSSSHPRHHHTHDHQKNHRSTYKLHYECVKTKDCKNPSPHENHKLGWMPWTSRACPQQQRVLLVTSMAVHKTTCLNIPPIVLTALMNNMTLIHHAQTMADHNLGCQEYWKQDAVDAVIIDKIICKGVDSFYIEELDDNFVRYSAKMTKSIIAHLCHEWCIVTTLEQKQAATAFRI